MSQKIVIVGYGSIGQAVVPLLRRAFPGWEIVAIEQAVDDFKLSVAFACAIAVECQCITQENFEVLLRRRLHAGDILLNLANEVCTADLITLSQSLNVIYLDTNIERWPSLSRNASLVSNYTLREEVLALREGMNGPTTAIVAHGANPGFISILLKQALFEMATAVGLRTAGSTVPNSQNEWAQLASDLGIRTIQISENDTQKAIGMPASEQFSNTWSVPGFVTECRQLTEVGWGSHERALPPAAQQHITGRSAAICLASAGYQTIVESWSPLRGTFSAMVLTHNESISIAEYFSLTSAAHLLYRPTVYYAYRPIDLAIASLRLLENEASISEGRVLKGEISSGVDELGVLLISDCYQSFWFGSALSIDRTRKLAPYNNATSLQVASSIVGALAWAVRNPVAGIVESEQMDHVELYAATSPFWEPIQRSYTDWPHESAPQPLRRIEFESLLMSDSSI